MKSIWKLIKKSVIGLYVYIISVAPLGGRHFEGNLTKIPFNYQKIV